MTNRLLVIGIDGADWKVINPILEQGRLPHLARLRSIGVHGSLRSTIPPLTGPAWTSLVTGVNPGRHGIFDFWKPLSESNKNQIVSSNDVKVPRIWQILNHFDKKAIIVNLPLTFPVQPLNGLMLAGMLSPDKKEKFSYPPQLISDLEKKIGEYFIDAERKPEDSEDKKSFSEHILEVLHRRAQAVIHLLDEDWDFFMVVFTAIDRAQHFFWHCQDSQHKLFNSSEAVEFRDFIAACYQEFDFILGEIIKKAGSDISLLLVSDHGFGPLNYQIHLNNYLVERGFLKLKENINNEPMERYILCRNQINWQESLAILTSETGQGITLLENDNNINQKFKIKRYLESLSFQNTYILGKIYTRDEIYHGSYAAKAPDLIFSCHQNGFIAIPKIIDEPPWIKPAQRITGHHRDYGIFLLVHPEVRSGKQISNAHIFDILPTILYILDCPIPENLDGNAILSAFQPEQIKPIKFFDLQEIATIQKEEPEASSSEEEIKARLESLGYLS